MVVTDTQTDTQTDRHTDKHFKNITSLAEVIKENLEGNNIDPLAAGGAGGLYTYTLKVIMPKITKKSEIRSESGSRIRTVIRIRLKS